jgi:DNA repair protein RecN (Recombination protein N)
VLKLLTIQNIVLIDKCEINFSGGLCVLSGETGSGKSILLDALGLAIGFRSNLRLIGSDENKASVLAEFDISKNQNCQEILRENDLLDLENPNELRIRRVIQETSSSKAYVNDIAIGINILAKIGESLIEIHGQHDQRGLLNAGAHIEILDEFSQNQNLLKNLKKHYEKIRDIDTEIAEINNKKEQAKREKDYLEYIIKELENADIKEDEENILVSKKEQLLGKEKIINFLSDFKSNLLEANSNLLSAQKLLIRNQNVINSFLNENKDDFEKLSEKIDGQNSNLDQALSTIEVILRETKNSDDNLEEIEERIFLIRGLSRKFNVPTLELPKIILDAQEKLKLLNNEAEIAIDLDNKRKEAIKDYKKVAEELSEKRKKSAVILAKKVEEELKFLKMENVKFLVNIKDDEEKKYSPHGYEEVRFTASLNKNNFDDISKIASGGELSRFMLALKVALMDVRSVPTMIFDEIDTGIGGSTADAVGKRLKILSKNLQILVVTHQPQIASKADLHFKISKTSQDKKVKTVVEALSDESRKLEIARMLSGELISKEAIAAAENLIGEGNK